MLRRSIRSSMGNRVIPHRLPLIQRPTLATWKTRD